MFQAEEIRLRLLKEFVASRAKNSRYSMRAFAKRLGMPQSSLSEIMAGKRDISKKSAQKILKGLGMEKAEASTLIERADSGIQKYTPIDMDKYHIISDWYYYAILSLTETDDFQSSLSWMAQRLGLSESTTKTAINRLCRLGLLHHDKKTGTVTSTGARFEALSSIANPALKRANIQNIKLAARSLEATPVELRDLTAMTLCFDPDRIDDARTLIKNFRRNFSRVMESGHKKEVYKMCIQLFPLSGRIDA